MASLAAGRVGGPRRLGVVRAAGRLGVAQAPRWLLVPLECVPRLGVTAMDAGHL